MHYAFAIMLLRSNRLSSLDRRAGRALREASSRAPGAPGAARVVAAAMSPAFRLLVAAMIARPAHRRAGLEALAAGTLAATAARIARDRLGRPRPGPRSEGGFPSRHAAAAIAIAGSVGHRHPTAGAVLGGLAAVGLVGRAVTGQHDPADLVAGAVVGAAAAVAVAAIAGRLSPSKESR